MLQACRYDGPSTSCIDTFLETFEGNWKIFKMIKCSTPARPKGLKGNTSVISIRALNLKFVKHLGNKNSSLGGHTHRRTIPAKDQADAGPDSRSLREGMGGCNLESDVVTLLVLREPNR